MLRPQVGCHAALEVHAVVAGFGLMYAGHHSKGYPIPRQTLLHVMARNRFVVPFAVFFHLVLQQLLPLDQEFHKLVISE